MRLRTLRLEHDEEVWRRAIDTVIGSYPLAPLRTASIVGGLSIGIFASGQPAGCGGTVDAGPDIITCGGQVQLQAIATGNFPDPIWEWGPVGMLTNPSIPDPIAWVDTTITYYVWVYPMDHPECAAMDSVTITLVEPMLVTIATTDANCAGACTGSAHISTIGGTGPFTYSWNGFADSTSSEAWGLCAGYYSMNVLDANGCMTTADYVIGEPEPLQIDAGADTMICAGQFQLQATTSIPVPDLIWQWAPVDQLSGADSPGPLAWVIANTTYTVWAWPTGYPECAAMDSIHLTVDPGLDPGIDSLIMICPSAPPFELISMLGGSPASGGTWTDPFGMAVPPMFDPISGTPGTYSYTVSSPGGCMSMALVDIQVMPLGDAACNSALDTASDTTTGDLTSELILEAIVFTHVPNAFTPNGDGYNDDWGIIRHADGIRELELQVFDRWGAVVFETKDASNAWDGTFRDQGVEVVKEDVYAYRIIYYLAGRSEARELIGHVMVLR